MKTSKKYLREISLHKDGQLVDIVVQQHDNLKSIKSIPISSIGWDGSFKQLNRIYAEHIVEKQTAGIIEKAMVARAKLWKSMK